MKLNNSKINFIIDILLFMVMIPVAAIGIIIKIILIPGSERWIKYGDNVELYIWGMDRHQWGTIHLIFSLIMIGLFVLHIIFHWKLIINWFKRFIRKETFRIPLFIFLTAFIVICWILPFVIKPEIEYGVHGVGDGIKRQLYNKGISQEKIDEIPDNSSVQNKGQGQARLKNEKRKMDSVVFSGHNDLIDSIDVRGSMSLSYIAEKYNIPAEYIKGKLDIPESEPSKQNMGSLRRKYGFHMDDVREIIYHYKNWE
ncbi:DUF4405 domain-containing protein [Bacteroidota bacterium]